MAPPDPIETFQRYLRNQGLKLTTQRERIVRRVLKITKHFSAEELFDLLRKERSRISKATVYRTLSLLVEARLLAEHDFELGHKLYEKSHRDEHHDHLICVACRAIFEFHNHEIERLQEEVAESHDFAITYHTHQIFGTCSEYHRTGRLCSRGEARMRRD
ncbi:MAG: Fur family transcriptional regulator [Planctomycetota bacterium]